MKKHATRHPITRKYSFQEKKKEVRPPTRKDKKQVESEMRGAGNIHPTKSHEKPKGRGLRGKTPP